MSPDKLARMANAIASFFESYPHDEAVAGIHDHIRAFWTPKMRMALRDAATAGASGLHPLVVDATSWQGYARNPASKEAAGPSQVGEIGASDAG